ncbi:MAG TPA: HNH endonuclease signature motif containing protein [Bacteroidales bacterium]|nr:HNH endonuclease signature motif containing protein [Bacteroidales bacterium]HPZ04218.1 HNH endonuclease signature motif containing protein [Bacteroidales bacterium]HQB75855.1 HNH endonuclease signature motif containing protein [Bacteroidales bacterium]
MTEELDIINTIKEIEDYLIPFAELDTYEKSLYYHLFRHSRLIGKKDMVFVISSAPQSVGITEFSARDRIRKLDQKRCIKINDTTRNGLRITVFIPSEIEGCIIEKSEIKEIIDIETVDFYKDLNYRDRILERENYFCFYCFKKISNENYALDHVTSQQNNGNNTYKNIVATCHECNSIKSGKNGQDYLRDIYRKGIISSSELEERLQAIEKLKNGELKPEI